MKEQSINELLDEGLGEVWGYDTEGKFKRLFRGHWRDIKAWFMEGGK